MDQEIIPLSSDKSATKPQIKAVGVGGAGHNVLGECPFSKVALKTPRDAITDPSLPILVLENDDIQYLSSISPELVNSADHKSMRKISDALEGAGVATIFAGLGGEAGSRLIPMTAYSCKKSSCLSIASVTMPFSLEGPTRRSLSSEALPKLVKSSHITISYPNDGLMKLAPDLPFHSALNVMNFFMIKPILDISNVITEKDVPILKSNLNKTQMRVGIGRGSGVWGEESAVQEALTSPWFDFNLQSVESALVIISAPNADEYTFKAVMKHLGPRIPNATIFYWTTSHSDGSAESEVTLLLSCP